MPDTRVARWSGSSTNAGTSEAVTINTGHKQRTIRITRFIASKSDGASAAWGPRILRSSGSDDIAFAYATTTDPATDINDTFDPPVDIETDSSGNLRLEPRFDAGADNDADYVLYYEIAAGSK